MAVQTTSQRGRDFLRAHEGQVLTCYLDPIGIPTIGTGFTTRSAAVRGALAKRGIAKLVAGKTKITAAQSDEILLEVLAAEFEPAVAKNTPETRKQNQFDAAVSFVFNLGVGSVGWQWFKLWRSGQMSAAAKQLAGNYNTAGGKTLPGLVRRRKEEAHLFEYGVYTGLGEGVPRQASNTKTVAPDPVVEEAQSILSAKGFDPGAVDGWMGAKTKAAVIAYQKNHPHLVADGVIGPATLAQLRRDGAATKAALLDGSSSFAASSFVAWLSGLPWVWVGLGVAALVLFYITYRKRDVLMRRINSMLHREVVT